MSRFRTYRFLSLLLGIAVFSTPVAAHVQAWCMMPKTTEANSPSHEAVDHLDHEWKKTSTAKAREAPCEKEAEAAIMGTPSGNAKLDCCCSMQAAKWAGTRVDSCSEPILVVASTPFYYKVRSERDGAHHSHPHPEHVDTNAWHDCTPVVRQARLATFLI